MVEATASIDVEVRATSGGEDELMVLSKQRSDEEEEQLARTSTGSPLNKKLTLSNETSRSNTPPKNHLNPTKRGMVSAAYNAAGGCGLLFAASPDHDHKQSRDVDCNQETEHDGTSAVIDSTSITENSDLLNRSRTIWIVTTAALPWRTGTSVNPLWRAVYLAQDGHKVYLLIPWLADENSRKKLYGTKNYFPNGPTEQIDWIHQNFIGPDYQTKIEIQFWNGVYQESFGSIFPVEDICQLIPNDEADVAILEGNYNSDPIASTIDYFDSYSPGSNSLLSLFKSLSTSIGFVLFSRESIKNQLEKFLRIRLIRPLLIILIK